MPIKRVQFPDGSIHRVEVPEGATNDQILAFVQSQHQQPPQPSREEHYADLQRQAAQLPQSNPTDGMSGPEKFMAGVGKSVYDTGRGISQLFGGMSREDVDRQREVDAPLMNTGAGIAGNIAGTVGQVVAPGGAAIRYGSAAPRLAAIVRSASLPRTLSGMAAQGGLIGLLQQVGTEDSRAFNAGAGTGLSVLGGGIPRAIGATGRAVSDTVGRFTQEGALSRAAQQIQREAADPAALLRPQPSQIPGVSRTLAQESLDPGVARLERNARSTSGGFDLLDSANNTARAEAIRKTFEGGTTASASAIKAARDQAAEQALAALPNAGAISKKPIQLAIQGAIDAHKGNPATQAALRDALAQMPEIQTANEAYNFRKYVDFLMSKQSDKPVLRTAKRELQTVKSAIDKAMTQAYPGWQTYLDDYVAQSRRADQARAGAALLRKGSAIPDAVTGEYPLSPAQVSRVAGNPDAFAAQVTRFPQATAANTFTPQQTGLLGLLSDDMARVNASRTLGSGGNSQTFERLAAQDRAATGLMRKVPIVGGLAGEVAKIADRRVQAALAEILADPSKYRSVVGRLPANQRHAVEGALSRIGGTAGALAPAFPE